MILEKAEADYIRMQIDSGDNVRIKIGLQRLSKSYWRGLKLHPAHLRGVVNSVVGTAFLNTIDEKVRRWVLNALARVGDEGTCLPAVLYLVKKYPDEPQTVAAGIAAIYKICKQSDPSSVLSDIDFDPQMRTLAALQHIPAKELDLKCLPIKIDDANIDTLKLALITVGLQKSPDNLFNPKHSDAEMVKVLGGHHDSLVSQYSIWAITENDKLNLKHLGIKLKDIENQTENVRGWLYQLLAIEATPAQPYLDYIELGMSDRSFEARKGLAIGLRNNFIDVFEPLVLDWVASEGDSEIRQYLLEHIVQQSRRSESYHSYAIGIYEGEPADSLIRNSMEASAVGMPIYTDLKRISVSMPGLFGGINMVNNNITIGNISAGAVALGGSTASNHGPTNIQLLTNDQIILIQAELAKIEAILHESENVNDDTKKRALDYVNEAKQDPSPSKIQNVIEFIGNIGNLAEAGTALAPYVMSLGRILGI